MVCAVQIFEILELCRSPPLWPWSTLDWLSWLWPIVQPLSSCEIPRVQFIAPWQVMPEQTPRGQPLPIAWRQVFISRQICNKIRLAKWFILSLQLLLIWWRRSSFRFYVLWVNFPFCVRKSLHHSKNGTSIPPGNAKLLRNFIFPKSQEPKTRNTLYIGLLDILEHKGHSLALVFKDSGDKEILEKEHQSSSRKFHSFRALKSNLTRTLRWECLKNLSQRHENT